MERLGGETGWRGWVERLGGEAGWRDWVERLSVSSDMRETVLVLVLVHDFFLGGHSSVTPVTTPENNNYRAAI